MTFKLNAAARIRMVKAATVKLDPWAKEMFAVIKKADKKADSDDMNMDGYYTNEATAKKIEAALKAAGYKAKKNSSGGYPGNSYAATGAKGKGVSVSYLGDEADDETMEAVLNFF